MEMECGLFETGNEFFEVLVETHKYLKNCLPTLSSENYFTPDNVGWVYGYVFSRWSLLN